MACEKECDQAKGCCQIADSGKQPCQSPRTAVARRIEQHGIPAALIGTRSRQYRVLTGLGQDHLCRQQTPIAIFTGRKIVARTR